MHEPHISLYITLVIHTYHVPRPSKPRYHVLRSSQPSSTCINLNLPLYYIYVYSNNVVQKLPCQMAIIQNSGSESTSVCTHMNKKINLCTCPLYIFCSYPLFCCHFQSLRRSWAFFATARWWSPSLNKRDRSHQWRLHKNQHL